MYMEVRERFMVTDCKKCGTRHLNYTWSKLDFVSMTREVDELGKLIVNAYYLPTQQTHSTVRSILARTKEVEDEELTFVWEAQRGDADEALRFGHILTLTVLELQKEHFTLITFKEELETCFKDYHEIWLSDSDGKNPSAAL